MGWSRDLAAGISLVLMAGAAMAQDLAILERTAQEQYMDGLYGAADESIRAAITSANPEDFNRLILFQGLIASRMAGDGGNAADGRALLGMAVGDSQDGSWPRPVIDYLLGLKELQQVANAIRHAGISSEAKKARLCELSFYAAAFAVNDGEKRFAVALLDKADETCAEDATYRALAASERERLELE
ncbi:hypothetical protein [Dongia sp.]|uniref:hypothetical protein n=1 Tax=Dongia sp. TaxID=1977262 RepID=UPI0035B221E2